MRTAPLFNHCPRATVVLVIIVRNVVHDAFVLRASVHVHESELVFGRQRQASCGALHCFGEVCRSHLLPILEHPHLLLRPVQHQRLIVVIAHRLGTAAHDPELASNRAKATHRVLQAILRVPRVVVLVEDLLQLEVQATLFDRLQELFALRQASNGLTVLVRQSAVQKLLKELALRS